MTDTKDSLFVVFDGGAFAGVPHAGAVQRLHEHVPRADRLRLVKGGISIGSLIAAFDANGKDQDDYRRLFLRDFLRPTDFLHMLLPEQRSVRRLALGGLADMVPSMRRLVSTYRLEPRDDMAIIAFDLITRKLYAFEGDYDLAVALSASCSVYPLTRPTEWRDSTGKLHLLVDAAAYLLHARLFTGMPTLIVRLFPVARRQPSTGEQAVMLGDLRADRMIRRPSSDEYDRSWQRGYDCMDRHLLRSGGLSGLLPAFSQS